MNTKHMLRINKFLLNLSKCFYKVGLYVPGRWIGRIRQFWSLNFLEKFAKEKNLFDKKYSYENEEQDSEKYIFVLWYQGFDNLPPIIEKCIESIKKHIKNRKLVLISWENIKDWADLPDYIYEKLERGDITKTFFSDILRSSLLYKYGGCWLDAAIFLTDEIDESYFDRIYYCPSGIKTELKKDFRYLFHKTQGWNVSFQGTNQKHFLLYDFLYHYYLEYFKIYDSHCDYFQNDFCISLFLKNNKDFRKIVLENRENNTQEFILAEMMNRTLTEKTKKKIDSLLQETKIHKLTYKKNWKRQIKNMRTVYDYTVFGENK